MNEISLDDFGADDLIRLYRGVCRDLGLTDMQALIAACAIYTEDQRAGTLH